MSRQQIELMRVCVETADRADDVMLLCDIAVVSSNMISDCLA